VVIELVEMLSLPKEVNYAIYLKEKALFGDCTSPLNWKKRKNLIGLRKA
jgi:hypothetical protein